MDNTELRKMVGEAIRRVRESQRLSQEKLALMIGTSKAQIWRIEKGRIGATIDELNKIANALDVEIRSFFPQSAMTHGKARGRYEYCVSSIEKAPTAKQESAPRKRSVS